MARNNITLYVADEDTALVEDAKKVAKDKGESLSGMLMALLRRSMAARK